MKLCFSESEITWWAEQYDSSQSELSRNKERSLINLRSHIQCAGFLTKEQLSLVAHWKAPRSAGHSKKNSDEYVSEITSWALSAKDERSKIEVLTLLDGVLWPSASVILHFFHQEPYPILDFRALQSLGLEEPKKYSFSFWWEYVEFCRAVAQRNNLEMRTLDRALWKYSKDHPLKTD